MRNEKGQFVKGIRPENTTHGLTGTPFHNVYYNLRDRCTNQKNRKYPAYGGRGIKCLWESFDAFREDMYESYLQHRTDHPGNRDTQIDRINNDEDYCKENCRWVTCLENTHNTRRNVVLTYEGETKILRDWARETGIKSSTLAKRIRDGWTVDKALTAKVRKCNTQTA